MFWVSILVDFGVDRFSGFWKGWICWACGMELLLGALRGEEDSLVRSSRLEKKIERKEERERIKFILF